MRALVWNGPRDVAVTEVPEPQPADGEVIVNVVRAGICGSDLHAYRGEDAKRVPPLILGHEAVGTVEGDTDLVAIFPLVGCGTCDVCRIGLENLCRERSLLGLHRPGTFAERVAVREDRLVMLPVGMPAGIGALVEPLATSIAALDARKMVEGRRVVVIGCGSIGLLASFAACMQGAEVDAVDPVESRRRVALGLGVGRVFEEVTAVPDDADVVIDAVGVEATWTAGLDLLRPGGTIVVVGLGQLSGSVPVGLMVRSGLSLRGSYGYGREHFEAAIELLSESPPDAGWLTERPLDDAPNAFAELVDRPSDVLKVLLTPSL